MTSSDQSYGRSLSSSLGEILGLRLDVTNRQVSVCWLQTTNMTATIKLKSRVKKLTDDIMVVAAIFYLQCVFATGSLAV